MHAEAQRSASRPAGDSSQPLALSEILAFRQAGTPASGNRVQVQVDLPVESAAELERLTTERGLLADAVPLACWLLLMRQWVGGPDFSVQVLGPAAGSSPEAAGRPLTVELSTKQGLSGWLQGLDTRLRASREATGDATPPTPAPEVRWHAGAPQIQEPAGVNSGLNLGFDSNEPGAIALKARLVLLASTSVLDEAQAGVVMDAWRHTVQSMIQVLRRGNAELDDIDTLGADGRGQILTHQLAVARARAPTPADRPRSIPEAFARQVTERGSAQALWQAGSTLTYRELDRLSNDIAGRLLAAGVLPGAVVGLALERSIDAIAALLGILKAGAAYAPLDSRYPPERIRFTLQDAAIARVIASRETAANFSSQAAVLVIEDLADDGALGSTTLPAPGSDSLAYVLYTSGSTGTPKGIATSHDAVLRLAWQPDFIDFPADRRMLHAAPLGFDASTLEVWGPLLNGGCCVLHDEALPTGPGLAHTIESGKVDTAWLTAALFNAVVDDDPRHLRGLRQLLIGGEALSVPHVRKALAALPDTQLFNGYGPTECTTFTTVYRIPGALPELPRAIPIGRPIRDTPCLVLGPGLRPMPAGLAGELYVGGRGLARGYLQRPELTAERFIQDPFCHAGDRLYRTGDRVRQLPDDSFEYLGRADSQVKINGFRIEPAEIEYHLSEHPAVRSCAVVAVRDGNEQARLAAYLVAEAGHEPAPGAALRDFLRERLPAFMVPSSFAWLPALPRTANGKLDARALPALNRQRPTLDQPFQAPANAAERRICQAFEQALGLAPGCVGRQDNFFELGGTSLLVLQVLAELRHQAGGAALGTTAFFSHPTPAALALQLGGSAHASAALQARMARDASSPTEPQEEPIAIIAMAGRFPGAQDVEALWAALSAGRDGITFFDKASLDPSLPPSLVNDPRYVSARGVVADVDRFDASFFGITPREAELMDPQQRVFMELCWECMERGGHAPDAANGLVGIFAGMYNPSYYQRHVAHRPDLIEKLGEFQVMLANEKDYIATRVAHRLNLTGPAVSVHTACSTSLVAIAQAFAALRSRQCDMALAGGIAITCPPASGHLYQDGAMLSPDGHTRSFSDDAQGTVFSDGAAVVLLKRLSDALADGDSIHALIRGVAVNNDGRHKASFTAPSVEGQAAVIAAAHRAAGVDPRSIGYVEAHGTATPLGDPVEVEALTLAFRLGTADTGFCQLGSLKSNVGHMVTAAGAGGVIKVALAMAHGELPPTLHVARPSDKIAFADSPFVLTRALTAWPRGGQVRRAGVSSFGVGGTNAHVVMEEAPLQGPTPPPRGPQLLQLSAKTPAALDRMAERLAAQLAADPAINLADVAHTLQHGRSQMAHRLGIVAETAEQAALALRQPDAAHRVSRCVPPVSHALVWLLPGQGAQYPGMGLGLHAQDPAFRAAFDEATAALQTWLPYDLAAQLRETEPAQAPATAFTQPATFCLEYALARAWQARGAMPQALVGHSVGEFAAAVIAGVMSLAEASRLVARRALIMAALPRGSMLSVRLPLAELRQRLPADLAVAAENGPTACVVAGTLPALAKWQSELEAQGVAVRVLQTSHAFHSPMMDAAVAPFEQEVRQVRLQAPVLPIASTLTGTWMTAADATEPAYWARHLREPVMFSTALKTVLADLDPVFLEVGPRQTLATLARQHLTRAGTPALAVASMADSAETEPAALLLAQGSLWTLGVELSANAASPAEGRRRILLPTYPFERKRHWVDAPLAAPAASAQAPLAHTPPPTTANGLANANAAAQALSSTPTRPPMPDTATAVPAQSPQLQAQLLAQLRELFEDVAGLDLSAADPRSPFAELGLDSLTLTQAALQIKRRFSAPLTFRHLMEQYQSLGALAEFLAATAPAQALPQASPAPAAPAPAIHTATALSMPLAVQPAVHAEAAGGLQQIIAQQMQLMAQQLALLGGAAAAAPAPAGAAQPSFTSSPVAPTLAAPAPGAAVAAPAAETITPVSYDVKKAFGAIARIHTQGQALAERQQARLDAFMRRYIERTRKSREYTVAHRPHLADPRVVNGFRPTTKEITYQIVIERSKGSRLWDLDGNEYVDVLNGFGMNLFGWQPDFIQQAVRAQVDAGYEIGPQHPLAGEVAQLVCELSGSERAGLCNTGSEAVMAAVRIARTVTGRNTLVLFTGSYHGTFDEVLVRAGRGGKGIPAAPGIMPGVFGDVRVLDYGTPEALAFIREHADELAAVLVEPVQSRRPDFQPREFLQELRRITSASGTCLIFDEVITGFRSQLGGAQALFNVRADLACYGKVIGGGFPVGVVAGRREYMDALDGGAWDYGDDSVPTVGVTYFAGTFVRHPLALAAAKASLEHLKASGPRLQEQLNTSTAAMADELTAFAREIGAPLEIRHFASLWRISWLEDHPLQDLLFPMMRNRGVHILDNFPCFMTTAHTAEDIATIKSAFKESVAELQEAGFLPRSAPAAVVADASLPPVPNARLGRDKDGKPTWFVPHPDTPGKFIKIPS